MQRLMTRQKTFLSVFVMHEIDGSAKPFMIRYADGRLYNVRETVKSQFIVTDAYTGKGITKYTVRIGDGYKDIYRTQDEKWYTYENVYVNAPDTDFA